MNDHSSRPTMDKRARHAFEILVRENSRMLTVYLRNLVRDEAAVDDLFQEAMVVAWRRLDECDLDRPFGPWRRGIASRLVLAHYRKQKTAPVLLHESVLHVVDRHFENINLLAGDTWDDKVAAWRECIDALPEKQKNDSDVTAGESSERVAESLLIHGLLADMGSRNHDQDAERIRAVMQRIDSEQPSDSVTVAPRRGTRGRRRFAILSSALTMAAAVMVMFVVFGPHQSVSAAIASLEKLVEAAAKPFDRTYSVRIVEEYLRDKRPRNLSQEAWDRDAKEQIDGATLYVRGANQYVMTVMLNSGLKRTWGCDGQQSWAFRENGPVHVSTDLNRFRGGLPGQQQDIPFINIHAHLAQLLTGYDVELSDGPEDAADGTALSQLIGLRKSRDVRGPKQVEIWFDADLTIDPDRQGRIAGDRQDVIVVEEKLAGYAESLTSDILRTTQHEAPS